MAKILYAADNRLSSFYTLKRFLDTYQSIHQIKVAGYTKSLESLNADWNLDALLDFKGQYQGISFKNSNFSFYSREIKKFAPQVIISDMEIYSSYIGIDQCIPVWQVSPLLLYYGIADRINIWQKYSGYLFKNSRTNAHMSNILKYSDRRLIMSHLGDIKSPPTLKQDYEWLRPNHELSTSTKLALVKPCNAMAMADVYYSNRRSVVDIDYRDIESIVVGQLNCHHGLSALSGKPPSFNTTKNDNIKVLSQYLDHLDI